jgi:hypothetical protein
MIKWTYNEIARFEAVTAILRNSCLTVCLHASFIWEANERLSIKFYVVLRIKFWFSSLYIADFKTYNFVLRRVFSFSTRKLEPQVRIQLCRYMYVRVSSVLLVSFQMGQLRPITSVQRILKP